MKKNWSYILLISVVVFLSGCIEDPEFSRDMQNGGSPVFSNNGVEFIAKTASTIEFSAEILKENGYKITERGFVWSLSPNPTLENGSKIQDTGTGIGTYSGKIEGLRGSTTCYIRAYAINERGTVYGNSELQETTNKGTGAVMTTAATDIHAASATVGGKILDAGEGTIKRRGVYYSTSKDFVLKDSVESTFTTDSFTCHLSELELSTKYYFVAFVENDFGIFSDNIPDSLMTLDGVPQIGRITNMITGYNDVTLWSSSSNSRDTTVQIVERGFCWIASTSPSTPTIYNDTIHVALTGPFTTKIENLASEQQYWVRAYAKSQYDSIVYSEPTETFTTLTDRPAVMTEEVSNVQNAKADFSIRIISEGKSSIKEAGICWSYTNPKPTLSDNKQALTQEIGVRYSGTMNVKGGKTYYYRAYAINNDDLVGYGEEDNFTTPSAFTYGHTAFSGTPLVQKSNAYFSVGDNFYIAGGDKGPNYTDELWSYSISNKKWSQLKPLYSGAAKWQTAVTYGLGAFVYGGMNANGEPVNDFAYYDIPPSNMWQTNPGCPDSLHSAIGFAIGYEVFIVGGKNSRDSVQNTVWSFDVPTKQWTQKADFPEYQYGGFAVVIDNIVYAGMGRDSLGKCNQTIFISEDGGGTWWQKYHYPIYLSDVLGAVAYGKSIFLVASDVSENYYIYEFNMSGSTLALVQKSRLPAEYKGNFNCIYENNGKIYIGLGSTNTFVVYDPVWDNDTN
ncbi:MAG: hypothetical protein LBE91_02495 [Tannerella sp.]|nr:hypothetical protein [Tannerella sp.]